MRSHVFRDFDAFAESIRDVDSKMMLRNPKRRVWSVRSVDLGRVTVQLGKWAAAISLKALLDQQTGKLVNIGDWPRPHPSLNERCGKPLMSISTWDPFAIFNSASFTRFIEC